MPQPVNLTVRYIHSATPVSVHPAGCFVHGFDDIPFQEINMSVFQFRKTPLHRQGSPSRILAISPAIRDNTKVQNAVSTTSAESLAFFSSCASACARVSRWRSYYNSPLAGDPPRWPAAVLQPPGAAFRSQFQHPFRRIPFYDGGRVIKHLITLPTTSQNGHSCSQF